MLSIANTSVKFRARQSGVVLVIALIILVAMTLAGLALVRSVDTTNIIAGNLAFRQSATHASDKGIEAAIAWLVANGTGATLEKNGAAASGYLAGREDPDLNKSWDDFWNDTLDSQAATLTPDPDPAGNTVKFVIHRLCQAEGAATDANSCSFAPVECDQTSSMSVSGSCDQPGPRMVYYRITSQVTGPRGTRSYVQAMVAL